jgi:hypothetical protein
LLELSESDIVYSASGSKTGITVIIFSLIIRTSNNPPLRTVAYLRVGHAAHLVLVELVESGGSLLLAHVEAAGLDDTLDLAGVHTAVVVKVKTVESLVHVEAGLALETLAYCLSSNLYLEVDAPHVSELDLGVGVEAVVAAVDRVLVVGGTAVEHVRVVAISGEEGIGELVEVESEILVCVVAGDEKVNLITCREHTDGREALTDVSSGDVTTEVNVEDAESVVEVEVGLVGQSHLGLLKLTLKGDDVAHAVDKSVLLVKVEDGLLGGGSTDGAGAGVESAGAAVATAGEVSAVGARAVADGRAADGAASHGGATDGAATDGRAATDGGESSRGASHGAATDGRAVTDGRAATDGRATVDGGVSTGHGAGLEGGAVASALHQAAAAVGALSAGHRGGDRGASRRARAAHEV